MKFFLKVSALLTITFAALFFVSCENDDDLSTPSNSIVGTWLYEHNGENLTMKATYIFTKNNTYTINWYSYMGYIMIADETMHGTYVYKNNQITMKGDDGKTNTHSVSISGNKLILGGEMVLTRQ